MDEYYHILDSLPPALRTPLAKLNAHYAPHVQEIRLRLGQPVSVYIKSILPDKMKLKLVIVNRELSEPLRFALPYTQTEGHIDRWVYSTPFSRKHIETEFETEVRAAAGPCAGEQILL